MIATAPCQNESAAQCAAFENLLPRIQRQASYALRNLRPEEHDEAVQEVTANAYVAYARLVATGKARMAFASVLAGYGITQYRQGRRVGTKANVRDVSSPWTRARKGIRPERLDRFNVQTGQWQEVVVQDHRTPVPDQAAFRVDFPAWLARLPARDRGIAEMLAVNHGTRDVAKQFGLTQARISQKRHELHLDWLRYHGELPAA